MSVLFCRELIFVATNRKNLSWLFCKYWTQSITLSRHHWFSQWVAFVEPVCAVQSVQRRTRQTDVPQHHDPSIPPLCRIWSLNPIEKQNNRNKMYIFCKLLSMVSKIIEDNFFFKLKIFQISSKVDASNISRHFFTGEVQWRVLIRQFSTSFVTQKNFVCSFCKGLCNYFFYIT